MKILGRHLIAELAGCAPDTLNDRDKLELHMKEAVRESGATIVSSVFHRYNPQGISGVIVIAESHFSIHTWPEYGYAAVDFFTCGEEVDPYKAFESMKQAIGATISEIKELKRGIPSSTDEIIDHKPADLSVAAPAVS